MTLYQTEMRIYIILLGVCRQVTPADAGKRAEALLDMDIGRRR